MRKGFFIAIDGPVASGKGTIAPLLAKAVDGFVLYSGAMYRCLALLCLRNKVETTDEEAVIVIAKKMHIELLDDNTVFLNGKDVTQAIKKEEVAMLSSTLSTISQVRTIMVAMQQAIGQNIAKTGKIVVIEGRDTARRVFPQAALKIFLTASPEIRAKRRWKQILQRQEKASLEAVLEDVKKRDYQDSHRKTDPLSVFPEKDGYFVLDDTHLSEEETFSAIMAELGKRKLL